MIKSNVLDKKLIDNPNFCYLTKISNEHLNEYVDMLDNIIEPLTGFSGDTAYLYIDRLGMCLFVDGRFTIQAKKETKNIDIILINDIHDIFDYINDRMIELYDDNAKNAIKYIKKDYDYYYKLTNNEVKLYIDDRYFSYAFVKKLSYNLDYQFSDIGIDESIADEVLEYNKNKYLDHYKSQSSRKLFIFNNDNNLIKFINNALLISYDDMHDVPNIFITSNLEEIADITNLRLRPSSINDSLLFKAFLVVVDSKYYLYTDYDFESKNINKYLIKKAYADFYDDLKNMAEVFHIKSVYKEKEAKDIKYREVNVLIDLKANNLKIVNILKSIDEFYCGIYINGYDIEDIEEYDDSYTNYLSDELNNKMTIKSKLEISSIKHINEIDAIAMIKFIYALKHFDFDKYDLTEYSLKKVLDIMRSKLDGFLSTSFDTIVAFKENSAICHYSPKETESRIIKNNSILLVDSGANYLGGTTDITRVVSLYKDKNKIPKDIKHYYTLVLKSLLTLSNQKFPIGYNGFQLDIIARQFLYNECLNYGHGTGHGIGHDTNVHFGANTFSTRVKHDETNVLKVNQVQSCEPGIYFENKYGIRLENNTYTKSIKGTDYLAFDTLTLCPFDNDLIDYDELDKVDIERLNTYNKKVYDVMKKYFKADILQWLEKATRKV